MVVWLLLATCSYAFIIRHYIWKLTKVKITGHIAFVELCRTVTTDGWGNITSQVTEVKMTMHRGFVELCTAVTAGGGDISNQVTEWSKNDHAYRICINICYRQLLHPQNFGCLL